MSIDIAFTHFPTLDTERLHLRQLQPTDAEGLFAIRSEREVREPYGQEPYQSLADAQAIIQKLQTIYEQREGLFWVITLKGDDTMIGSGMLFNFDSDVHCAEIGYELSRAYWRQGIITEALPAVLTYGFADLGFHRIEANIGANNLPSQNVARKLGFTHEGTLRQRYIFRGQCEDQYCFGLLKNEWIAR